MRSNYIYQDCITSSVKIKLTSHKHSNNNCTTFLISCNNQLCTALKQYLSKRGDQAGPFICHRNLKPFTRNELVNQLKSNLVSLGYNAAHYNSHCFRIGKATDMATAGASVSQISTLGRWKSGAFKKYIKPQIIHTS